MHGLAGAHGRWANTEQPVVHELLPPGRDRSSGGVRLRVVDAAGGDIGQYSDAYAEVPTSRPRGLPPSLRANSAPLPSCVVTKDGAAMGAATVLHETAFRKAEDVVKGWGVGVKGD